MPSPSDPRPRQLGNAALLLIVAGLAASLVQTVRRRDLDPVESGISLYALGPQGVVQAAAIVAVGLGSIALAAGLQRVVPARPGAAAGSLCVALWGGSIAVAGLVPFDPDPPVSFAGAVHDAAGTAANLFLVLGIALLSRPMAGDPRWRPLGAASVPLAALALAVVVVANLGRPAVPWGIGQRAYVLLLLGWLVDAGLRLRRPPAP
jgi:hypothetical protein